MPAIMPAFPLRRARMDLVTFVSNHPFLCAAAVTLAGMIVYVEAQLITRGGNDLGLVQAIQLVNSDAVVVDVRSPERYQTGHIAGARNVPFEVELVPAARGPELPAAIDELVAHASSVTPTRRGGVLDRAFERSTT